MKLYKSLFLVAAIVGGMMTSCSEDGYWDEAKTADFGLTNGSAFSFNSKSLNYVYYPSDSVNGTDINVTITRSTTSGVDTLPISAVFSDTVMLSGPTSVVFENGSNTAVYPIHFNQEIQIGQTVTADLVIDTTKVGIPVVEKPISLDSIARANDSIVTAADSAKYLADSTAYAIYLNKLAEYKLATKVTIMKDYNWTSLGKGTMVDNYWFENGDAPASVTIMQAVENENIFRVVDPWTPIADAVDAGLNGNQTNLQFRLLQVGETLYGQEITMEDLVYFEESNTGYHHPDYDADIWIIHPAEFTASSTEAYWTYNKVLSYQKENGLPAVVQLAPRFYMYGVGGWNKSQADNIIRIVFPDVKIYDYSTTLEYVGLFTDPANVVYALADYAFTGDDAKAVKNVKVAIVNQSDDAEAVADAIAAGDYEAASLEDVAKDGRIQMAIPEGLAGKLQILMVLIDKNEAGEDEAKNVVAAKFEYFAGENPWKALGTGYYTEDIIYSTFTAAGQTHTYEVDIEESNSTPGLYRLKTPYAYWAEWWGEGDGEEDIIVHAEIDNGAYILDQPMGLTYDGIPMSIETRGGYLINNYSSYDPSDVIAAMPDRFGKVEDGVISFPVFQTQNSAGADINYQAYLNIGENFYYVGKNGAISVTLPGASASAKAKAKANAKASQFIKNMMKYSFAGKAQNKSFKTQDKALKLNLRNMSLDKTQK